LIRILSRPTQTTPSQGENRKKTLQLFWGRKNPMSYPSRMKNPDLPYPSVAAALRAYVLCPAFLDVQPPWELLLPSLAYQGRGSLRPSYALPLACRVLLSLCLPYLDHPLCAISCIDHCHIRHASFPPKAYRRRKGDSSINYHYTTRRTGCVCAWVSFVPRPQLLGPRQGSPLLERRQENHTVYLSRLPGSIR